MYHIHLSNKLSWKYNNSADIYSSFQVLLGTTMESYIFLNASYWRIFWYVVLLEVKLLTSGVPSLRIRDNSTQILKSFIIRIIVSLNKILATFIVKEKRRMESMFTTI